MEAGGCSLRGLRAAGSARCPRWRGEEARPRRPCAGQLGRGKDSAPGRRCAVPARQPARVRSGPRGGSPEKPRRGRVCRPPARRGAPETPRDRARGRAAARVGPGAGARGPPEVPAPQVRGGALRVAAPPGAGEEDGNRRGGEPGGGAGVPAPCTRGQAPERRPLARGRRSGREAPALTSRGPAGDGGSGHSTPHRPPPRRPLTAASDVTAHGAGLPG